MCPILLACPSPANPDSCGLPSAATLPFSYSQPAGLSIAGACKMERAGLVYLGGGAPQLRIPHADWPPEAIGPCPGHGSPAGQRRGPGPGTPGPRGALAHLAARFRELLPAAG